MRKPFNLKNNNFSTSGFLTFIRHTFCKTAKQSVNRKASRCWVWCIVFVAFFNGAMASVDLEFMDHNNTQVYDIDIPEQGLASALTQLADIGQREKESI